MLKGLACHNYSTTAVNSSAWLIVCFEALKKKPKELVWSRKYPEKFHEGILSPDAPEERVCVWMDAGLHHGLSDFNICMNSLESLGEM